MGRAVWVGALAVVGAINTTLVAQPVVWRSVDRPAEPRPVVRATSGGAAGVTLDRPIARGSAELVARTAAPRAFPDSYRQGTEVTPPPYREYVDRIPVIAPAGSIIAVSAPAPAPVPMNATDAEDVYRLGEQFATDRPAGQAPADLRLARIEGPVSGTTAVMTEQAGQGNWLRTYPATPPPTGPFLGELPAEAAASNQPRFYARAEYLLWWTKNDRTPPLLTTGTETAQVPPRIDGALGNPDTVVLFGGTLDRNPFSGGRLTVGYGLDDCGDKFIELTGFFLGQRSVNFTASSAQYPFLARPFFAVNPNLNQELVEVVTATGVQVGSFSVRAPSQLWGVEPNLVCNVCQGCDYRFDALAGFRYLNLRESLTIVEDIFQLAVPGAPFPGTRFQVMDRFATTNQFYGGQVGVRGSYRWDRLTLGGEAKLAAGVTHETSTVAGSFTFPPGTAGVDPRTGGLLALGSNSGTFSRDRFAVVPQVGVRVGYDVTEAVRLSVGYDFLYWSSVLRPGNQIDRNLDVTQIPNFGNLPPGTTPVSPPRPTVLLKDTDYWAQGVSIGLEFRY